MAKAAGTKGRGDSGKSPSPRSPMPAGGQPTGPRKFVRESWGELRKVQWPTRRQVAQGTLVVGVVTLFFALYLTLIDLIVVRLVDQLNEFLRQ